MAPRSSWKGFLRLSLISVPVKAYTAGESGGGTIHLNQLHRECNNRIKYQKTCPVHGEVAADEIVSGYEYAKGQFVVIDEEELDKLRTESDKAINIDTFVPCDALDPVYHSGKTYYLVPDGPIAQRPYVLMHRALQDEEVQAVARVVMHSKEQLVLLRPIGRLLGMTILSYDSQVKKPDLFDDEIPPVDVSGEELKLIKTLVESSMASHFDLASYNDMYTQRLTALVEAKVAGREVVAAGESAEPEVINLMDALKQSVAKAQQASKAKEPAAARPPKKLAASKTRKPASKKKIS